MACVNFSLTGFSHAAQALHALEVGSIIAFLPTLLNQLLGVLLNGGPDVATNVTRVMVHVIDQVYEAGRDDLLHSYIKVNTRKSILCNFKNLVYCIQYMCPLEL